MIDDTLDMPENGDEKKSADKLGQVIFKIHHLKFNFFGSLTILVEYR